MRYALSRYFRAKITENRPIHKEHNLLTLHPFTSIHEPMPGQFYMVGVEGDYDPLLKRPFGLLRRTDGGFQILYRIRGRGTALLRNMGEGTVVDVLGPLGNSYPTPEEDQTPVVVAGGIGIASLFPLIEHLAGRCHVLYGARNCHELFLMEELRTLSKELLISTDDGSQGERGPIVGLLHGLLSRQTSAKAKLVLYACGPRPMLRAVREAVRQGGITAYVSMEENMACGIGACLGCVVKTVNGHKRVCKEGPVFPIEEIVW